MAREWESLNAKTELARMRRDGHCHEAVKWYVHHLPKSMKTLTLCESKADPRWKRATEGRRPKDRSVKGGSLVSPGLASQRDRFLTARLGSSWTTIMCVLLVDVPVVLCNGVLRVQKTVEVIQLVPQKRVEERMSKFVPPNPESCMSGVCSWVRRHALSPKRFVKG